MSNTVDQGMDLGFRPTLVSRLDRPPLRFLERQVAQKEEVKAAATRLRDYTIFSGLTEESFQAPVEAPKIQLPVVTKSPATAPKIELPSVSKNPAIVVPSVVKNPAVVVPSVVKNPAIVIPAPVKNPAIVIPSVVKSPSKIQLPIVPSVVKNPAIVVPAPVKNPAIVIPSVVKSPSKIQLPITSVIKNQPAISIGLPSSEAITEIMKPGRHVTFAQLEEPESVPLPTFEETAGSSTSEEKVMTTRRTIPSPSGRKKIPLVTIPGTATEESSKMSERARDEATVPRIPLVGEERSYRTSPQAVPIDGTPTGDPEVVAEPPRLVPKPLLKLAPGSKK